jgi:hypothetical protein
MGGKELIHELNWRELDGLLADCDDPRSRRYLLAEIKALRVRWAAELERRAQARPRALLPDTVRECRKCHQERPHRTLRVAGKVWVKGETTTILPALVVCQCRECDRLASRWRAVPHPTWEERAIAGVRRPIIRVERGRIRKHLTEEWRNKNRIPDDDE